MEVKIENEIILDEIIIFDLELTLTDENNKKIIYVNKNILCSNMDYFEKLLRGGFKENNFKEITINVPNVTIANDIIMSFHKKLQKTDESSYPNYFYILESIKFHEYFALKYDLNSLNKIKIPDEGFDLLLDVVELIGYTRDTIKLIYNNLPLEYDLLKLPKKLLVEILKIIRSYDLNNVKFRTICKLNEFGLDHDKFMTKLMEYDGVISGSFMFMNFFDLGEKMICNDIDIYICDNLYFNTENLYFHPFENYILENITDKYVTKDSYIYINGMLYSRTYIYDKININFILLSNPCKAYIFENFDLDCCKIIYDGINVEVFDIENLIEKKTIVRYNKCTSDEIYQGKPQYSSNTNININSYCKMVNSIPFIKFKILYDIYRFNKKLICDFPIYTHTEMIISPNGNNTFNTDFCGSNYVNLYTEFINEIFNTIDLDKLFNNGTIQNLNNIDLTDDHFKIISMIRTLERIEKYKERGILEITLINN